LQVKNSISAIARLKQRNVDNVSVAEQIVFCEPPDLHRRSPNSGELPCKPMELKKTI
jgi:hypothetical protein